MLWLIRRTPASVLQPASKAFFSTTNHPSDITKFGNVLGGDKITPEAMKTFDTWHDSVTAVMKSGSAPEDFKTKMGDRVHEAVQFHPPTYFKPWEGRDEFLLLITAVSEVFGTSFTYGRQWLSPDGKEWCLEFSASINGDPKTVVNGVDMVSLDDTGKITDFRVLARPPNAVDALKGAMMKKVPPRMAKLKAQQAIGKVGNLFKK